MELIAPWMGSIPAVGSVTVASMGSVAVTSVEWIGSVASVELVTPVELHCEVGGSGVDGSRIDAISRLSGLAASIEPDIKQALDYHCKFH